MNILLPTPSHIPSDGLTVTAAEPWFRQKHQLMQQFLSAFIGMVSGRVNDIVLVDLFAGNGLFAVGNKQENFSGIALAALQSNLPISKYVLCERDEEQARILKIRINKYFRGRNIVQVTGRSEEIIEKLRMYVPAPSRGYKVAVFVVCDPFALDPGVEVIQQFCASGYTVAMPFTFPLGKMNNYRYYLKEERLRIGKFLGDYAEVAMLERNVSDNTQFYRRLVNRFNSRLMATGASTALSVHKLDSGLMEIPYYYVGLFSGKVSAEAIQQDATAASNVQFDLFTEN